MCSEGKSLFLSASNESPTEIISTIWVRYKLSCCRNSIFNSRFRSILLAPDLQDVDTTKRTLAEIKLLQIPSVYKME